MSDLGAIREEIAAVLGDAAVLDQPRDKEGYERGARYGAGSAALVIRPASTDDVRMVVRWARRHSLHLVTQGANSNLVGAASPDPSGTQIVVSLERMRHCVEVDVENRSAVVSAGVTLQALNDLLGQHGLCFPIDLDANPTIGGMIAMNTGGARLIRYGSVRRNVLGLEVVLGDQEATVLDLMSALRKDNSGVDLKQLFIGTSGSFGIITRAILELHPLPRQRATAHLVPRGYSAVNEILRATEARFSDFLTSFEGMSRNAVVPVLEQRRVVRNPFVTDPIPEYMILVELTSAGEPSKSFNLQDALEDFLGELLEYPSVPLETAPLADPGELWGLRHSISEGLRAVGRIISFDISMTRSALASFRDTMIGEIATRWPFLVVCDFGHFGDGGQHFNILWPNGAQPAYDPDIVFAVRETVYDRVVRDYGGSFSAEHGIGPFNQRFYDRYTSRESLSLSGALKEILDPSNLLGTVRWGPRDEA